jgi:hypothetical protein
MAREEKIESNFPHQQLYLRLLPASYVPAFTQTFPDLEGVSWNVATNSSNAYKYNK